jgi:predicted Zn-ribbon and HTH transcriptional regulator
VKNRIAFYPSPLPDEHILGTLARWHEMQIRSTFRKSISEFTSNITGINPSCIWRPVYGDIYRIYEGDFPAENFLNHTLWHYYAPFNHHSYPDVFNNQDLKVVPMDQIRLKTARNWRWCHQCAREDMEAYGTTYWHLSHQIPSMTYCQKHGEQLIHACNSCGFNSTDLETLHLPPIDDKCPACKTQFHRNQIVNPVMKWLDEISTKLISSTRGKNVSDIKRTLIDKAKLPQPNRRIPSKDLRLVATIQSAFDNFFYGSDIVDHFFKFPKRNLGARYPYLRMSVMLYSETFLPPIYYILLMKFLIQDDCEVEHILLGKDKLNV